MVSDQIGHTIAEIIAFFMAGYSTHYAYYYDSSLLSWVMVLMFAFLGMIFAARSVELL